MTLGLPNAEQQAITVGIATFLAARFPLARFRATHASPTSDGASWQALASMGALGIALPASDGGLGLSWVDEVLACREAGRQLVSPALVGSIIAAHIAARAGLRSLRDALLRGERRAGVAIMHSASELRVVDGDAGVFLQVEPGGARLLECDTGALQALACIDETVRLCAAPLPARELAGANSADLMLAARLLTAALLCGLLEATRDMAAEYARTRAQFGRPIGAFQSIKHRCADIALAAELCWSQTLHAADALAGDAPDTEFHVLSAALLAGEEALKATRFNIQAHGAMGFTDEVDAHRLMKRAHVLHQLFGDARAIPSRLMDLRLDVQ
jgi:alkylation response protein AidB-like acyl-CoA dehydrogenase